MLVGDIACCGFQLDASTWAERPLEDNLTAALRKCRKIAEDWGGGAYMLDAIDEIVFEAIEYAETD
jgi:hypothetical protein